MMVAEADSAGARALFECDSTNQVLMNLLSTASGNRIEVNVTANRTNTGGLVVEFECKEDSLMAEIQLRDRVIKEQTEKIKTLEVEVEVEKPLGKWDSFCIVLGYIFMGCLALLIVTVIVITLCKIFMKK